MSLSDDATALLLVRIAASDREALRELYKAAAPRLFGVLMRILGDRSEAEEILQDAFIRIWARAGRYDPAQGSGEAWVIAVTRNLAIDRLRARPSATGPQARPEPDPVSEATVVAAGRSVSRNACLDSLPDDRAHALRSAYLLGLSYGQLAEHHAVPPAVMRDGLRRSLLQLRECLAR